jgi:O-antigen/teichoic acid export membrane protein
VKKPQISEKKKRALTNIAWAISGKIVSLTGVLVVGIIVARYLGKEQYGIMNYVISFVAIFQVFADFGLDFIQIREESKHPAHKDKIIGTTFTLKLFFAILTLLAILIITTLSEHDGRIRCYIMIYALSVILNTSWVSRNHFTSIVWNEYVVKTEISRTLIGMAIKIAFVLLHLPLIWFIVSLVIDSILLAVGYTASYIRKIDSVRKWNFDRDLAVFMLKQSFPLLLSGAAIVVYNRIDQMMIGKMIDQSHLGVYSVAVRFTELLVFVPTIIAQTISPILVEVRQKDAARYE